MEQKNLLPESSRFFNKLLLVLLCSIAFAAAVNHYEATALVLRSILQVLYPIFVGVAFAFVLSIPQEALEKILGRHRQMRSHARSLSIVLSLTGGIIMLFLFANAFIPQFIQTLRGFGTALPEALHEVAAALSGVPTLQKYVVELESVDWNQMMQRVQEYLASGQTEAVYSAVHTTAEFVTTMVETLSSASTSLAQRKCSRGRCGKCSMPSAHEKMPTTSHISAAFSGKNFMRLSAVKCSIPLSL